MDGHRDAASGRVPLRMAADAIGTSIRVAAHRRRYSGVNQVLASESYEEDDIEEAEDMEDDGAVLSSRCSASFLLELCKTKTVKIWGVKLKNMPYIPSQAQRCTEDLRVAI